MLKTTYAMSLYMSFDVVIYSWGANHHILLIWLEVKSEVI
jgi:hypothetical protein